MANAKKTMNASAPPWMEGAKEIQGQEMIVVHMNNGELEGLDNLQGGPSIDPETGIREYSALGSIIEIPAVRQIFKQVADEMEINGKLSPDLHSIYESAKKHSLPYRESPEEEHNPLRAIEHTGRGGDTKMALIPLNLAFFLIELRHVPSINPKTGLLEFIFGFIKQVFSNPGKAISHAFKPANIIRVGATVAGAALGGPWGAGIGNTLGHIATGHDPGDSLMRGLNTGALTYGAQGIGQAAGLGASTPYTAGFFGGAPNMVASGLGSMGIGAHVPSAWSQVYGPANIAGNAMLGASPAAQIAAGAGTAGGTASGGLGSLLSNSAMLAPLGMAGLAYMGSKHQHKNNKQAVGEQNARIEKEREAMGFNKEWKPVTARRRKPNPKFYETSEFENKHGIFPSAFIDEGPQYSMGGHVRANFANGGLVKSYNKGALVTGPGKGQDDKIKTSVPDGSYIIDASSTSSWGDGSTKAGSNVLKEFEEQIKRKFPKSFVKNVEKEIASHAKQVPVWLSEGEHKIDPVTVTLLGKGSNEKGAAILKKMVIDLRKHKISKGDGLPPKAKHPSAYISQGRY